MKKRTLKNKTKGAGFFDTFAKTFVADNDLVSISLKNSTNKIKCGICSTEQFQRRRATMNKSKLANTLNDIVLGEDSENFEDISLICYFCNNCGNAIVIRDPKLTTNDTYQNLIVSTKDNTI